MASGDSFLDFLSQFGLSPNSLRAQLSLATDWRTAGNISLEKREKVEVTIN